MPKKSKRRILVASANPKNTTQLRLDEEIKQIKQAINKRKSVMSLRW